MKPDRRWQLRAAKDGRPWVRRKRDKRDRLTRTRFLEIARVDLIAARLAAVAQCVPLAQIQLWELGGYDGS